MTYKVVLDMRNAKTLTSVAMLETLWETRRSDMLDLITPFVKFAIAHTFSLNEIINITDVASFVKKEFGYNELNVPPILMNRGYVLCNTC